MLIVALLSGFKASVQNEFNAFFAHLANQADLLRAVSAQAFSQARKNFSHLAFAALNGRLLALVGEQVSVPHWQGLRVVAADASKHESKEPNAEVIMGKRVRKLGRDSFAKTARRLQIEYQSADGLVVLELSATEKIPVPKAGLSTCAPRRDIALDKQGHNILQKWLAARYRRAAFPEAFETRLRSPQLSGKETFLDRIEGILELIFTHT